MLRCRYDGGGRFVALFLAALSSRYGLFPADPPKPMFPSAERKNFQIFLHQMLICADLGKASFPLRFAPPCRASARPSWKPKAISALSIHLRPSFDLHEQVKQVPKYGGEPLTCRQACRRLPVSAQEPAKVAYCTGFRFSRFNS